MLPISTEKKCFGLKIRKYRHNDKRRSLAILCLTVAFLKSVILPYYCNCLYVADCFLVGRYLVSITLEIIVDVEHINVHHV